MTLAAALSTYTALNVALAVGVTGLVAFESLGTRFGARTLLSLHYWIAASLVASVLVYALLPPQAALFEPSARIWSAQEFHDFSGAASAGAGYLTFGSGMGIFDAGSVGRVWIAAALTLLALGCASCARDFTALRAIRRGAQRMRRLGRVHLWVSDTVATPFSYWVPGAAHVVVPSYLLERAGALRMVVAHELQHHRQRDTRWLYFFHALRFVCPLNPCAHLWSSRVARVQEFACDEALLARRGWTLAGYARCLLEVAQRAASGNTRLSGAKTFIRFGDPHVLIRRMEKMLQPKNWKLTRTLQVGVVAGLLTAMTAAAYAASGWVQDRRVTLDQAQQMAARVNANTGFVAVVNDEVLHELNRYAGTPEGREFMRAALRRFESHKGSIVAELVKHGVPEELAAIPLVESGYQNLDPSRNRQQAAGMWQFIPTTARAFGLRVDAQHDERLDPQLMTPAAARMLSADHSRFDDWQLAVLAYNMGGNGLQSAIDSTGSRDAWTLIRAGLENNQGYLARVHAAILIAANPQSVAP